MKDTKTRRLFLRLSLAAPALASLATACAPQRTTNSPVTNVPATATQSTPTIVESDPTAKATSSQPVPSTPTFTPTTQALAPTPTCDDPDGGPTPAQTEGPYYTPSTPAKTNFVEPGMTGTRMNLSGFVLTTSCKPVAKALLDLWHCDAEGVYDNTGFRLRGHFFTDENGYYKVETIMPGIYPGRTRHFHIKVQAPSQAVLTTQLYFPNEPKNASDGIFRKECLMEITSNTDGSTAGTFNFVLNL